MAECRELGIKPWGGGHPASWAAAQYWARKNHQNQEEESHIDTEVDMNTSQVLIAIDDYDFNAGKDYLHTAPNQKVRISHWQAAA